MAMCKKMKLDHQLIPYTHKKCRWKINLNISHDIIKALKVNISRKISDTLCHNIFTNISCSTRDMKERLNKWDFIKIKSFCTTKENISKMRREPTYGKIYLPMTSWTKV